MNTSIEINNINGIYKRTSQIILLFVFIIFLMVDATLIHFIFRAKWDWVLYVLISILGSLSLVLLWEKYIFIEITQDLLSIKQCAYLNSPKIPLIEIPINCIEHFEIEKKFYRNYIIIREERREKIRLHLKAFSNKQIVDIREYLEISKFNSEFNKV